MSDIADKIKNSDAVPVQGASAPSSAKLGVAPPPKETSKVKTPVLKRSAGGQKKKPVRRGTTIPPSKKVVSKATKESESEPSLTKPKDLPPSMVVARNYPAPSPGEDSSPPLENSVPPQGGRPDRSKYTRVKFSERNRVSYSNMDPNYMYRLVNDKDGRIEKLQRIGYELVRFDEHIGDYRVAEGSRLGSAVSKPVGNGTTGYLMKIPKEFYDEDRKAKDAVVSRTEQAMKPDKSKNETGPGLTND